MEWRTRNLPAPVRRREPCLTNPCSVRRPDCWTVSGCIPPTTTGSFRLHIRIILRGRLRRTHGKCFNQDRDTGLFDRVPIYSACTPRLDVSSSVFGTAKIHLLASKYLVAFQRVAAISE